VTQWPCWYGGKAEEHDRFVAFYGVAMGALPEGDGSRDVAAVIKPIGEPMTLQEFVAAYCNGAEPDQPNDGIQHVDAEPQLTGGDDIPGDSMPTLR